VIENLSMILETFQQQFKDTREFVFNVSVQVEDNNRVSLDGKVLEEQMVQFLQAAIYGIHPAANVDVSGLKVLKQKDNLRMVVRTNLTSLYEKPSFLEELLSQLVYGMQVDILEKEEDWVFVRLWESFYLVVHI